MFAVLFSVKQVRLNYDRMPYITLPKSYIIHTDSLTGEANNSKSVNYVNFMNNYVNFFLVFKIHLFPIKKSGRIVPVANINMYKLYNSLGELCNIPGKRKINLCIVNNDFKKKDNTY